MEENEKRDINMVAMEVIMNAGDGRDKIDEALAAMAEGKRAASVSYLIHISETISHFHCCTSKCRSPPCGQGNTYTDRDKWSDQNINFGFLRYCFSDFGSEDGYK